MTAAGAMVRRPNSKEPAMSTRALYTFKAEEKAVQS
jgi:hypothetical protein